MMRFHKARLRREYETLVTIPGKCDIVDAMLSYVCYYGIENASKDRRHACLFTKFRSMAFFQQLKVPGQRYAAYSILQTALVTLEQFFFKEVGEAANVSTDIFNLHLNNAMLDISEFLELVNSVEPFAIDMEAVREKLKSLALGGHVRPGPY